MMKLLKNNNDTINKFKNLINLDTYDDKSYIFIKISNKFIVTEFKLPIDDPIIIILKAKFNYSKQTTNKILSIKNLIIKKIFVDNLDQCGMLINKITNLTTQFNYQINQNIMSITNKRLLDEILLNVCYENLL